MKNKSILKEFFGLSQTTTKLGDNKIEIGKVYSDPYATAFKQQNEGSGIAPSFVYEDDDIEEYDVDENDIDEMEDFLAFLKTKVKEKEAYNESINEAEYQGRKVELNKPMQGDVKKFKVYVKNPAGRVVKVNFGQKGMVIKKNNPERRKSFRARMHCDNPGPRTKANYWSCRKW
jgi:hypothetical protein